MKISNPRVRFHRNGCFGESFYVVAFTEGRGRERRQLVATVFDGKGCVAVVDPTDAGACFRGDEYEPALRDAIEAAWNDEHTFGQHPCPLGLAQRVSSEEATPATPAARNTLQGPEIGKSAPVRGKPALSLVSSNDLPEYTITPARYAKGKMAVRCPSATGYKTRAARLIGDGLGCRWSGRSRAYIASPAQAARFERLYRAGFDASSFTGLLEHPDHGCDLTWREADRLAAA